MDLHDRQVKHVEEVRFSSDDGHELPFRLDIYKLLSGEHAGRFVGIVSQMVESTDFFDTPDDVVKYSKEIVANKSLIPCVQAAMSKR